MLIKKLHFIPLLIIGLVLSGCVAKSARTTESVKPPLISNDVLNSSQSPKISFTPLTDFQQGVEITVENVEKKQGQTIIELALNNHIYDLSQFDLKNSSTLAGKEPSQYTISNPVSGGHHLSAELIFTEELSGLLKIILNISVDEVLTFNFNIQ